MSRDPLIFIIAGEPSGDRIGAEIIKSIRQNHKGNVRFSGIGGDHMQEQGLTSIFPLSDLTLMGAIEIIPKLPKLYERFNQTLEAINSIKPDLVLTIDSPDFCLRVARKAKRFGFRVIHYTAPTVWAWRPGRAKKMAQYLDHLLLLYDFEKKYFDAVNLPNTFVGHPLCFKNIDQHDPLEFRKKYNLAKKDPLLCILPGSRRSEVNRLMPLFYEALKKLQKKYPRTRFVLPVASSVKSLVEEALSVWDIPVTLVEGEEDKYGAMNASKAALAASGTVTLELAMAKLPTVIAYTMNPITALLGKWLIKTPFIGLPNIILNRSVAPELIQEACTPSAIFTQVDKLLGDKKARTQQIKNFKELSERLTPEGQLTSERAGEAVLNYLTSQGVI